MPPRAPSFGKAVATAGGRSRPSGTARRSAPLHEIDMTQTAPPTIDTFDLATVEHRLCSEALQVAGGSINIAAKMLGITRHALRRRFAKYRITWTRLAAVGGDDTGSA